MRRALTVSELNEYVRRSLAADPMLRGIGLRGEISNFKRHSAGHLYFTLKDDAAKISCVMFRSAAASLGIHPRDGMRVIVEGSASLYAATGQYQFYVDDLRDDGVGALYIAFEQLKLRLQAEGIFDAGLKKPLPLLPRGIGIVTSPTGAVVHDITQVAKRRFPGIQLMLWPSAVQGDSAAEEITRGIRALDARPDIDVIIIGRGGGSLEELWAFNEEAVARAIYRCQTPLISAVGHETDFTIADFAADVRAATPSQAAELAVPSAAALRQTLDGLLTRLRRGREQGLLLLRHRLGMLSGRLRAHSPVKRIAAQRVDLERIHDMLALRMHTLLAQKRMKLGATGDRLGALSPDHILRRGYSMVFAADGGLIKSARQISAGDPLSIRLRDGVAHAIAVEETNGEKANGL